MLNRRAILSAVPMLPFCHLPKSESNLLTVGEAGIVIDHSMVINTINGFRFRFNWVLEPGDRVHVSTLPNVHALFALRYRPTGEKAGSTFAWSFHTDPLITDPGPADLDWAKDLSFRRGHEAWPKRERTNDQVP